MSSLCGECGKKIGMMGKKKIEGVEYCKECAPGIQSDISMRKKIIKDGVGHILVATTENIPGVVISKTHGIVSSRAIIKMDFWQDFAIALMDDFGGRSSSLQRNFKKAEKFALQEMKIDAALLGANAVVSTRLNFDLVETKKGKMLLVNAVGTAVSSDNE